MGAIGSLGYSCLHAQGKIKCRVLDASDILRDRVEEEAWFEELDILSSMHYLN